MDAICEATDGETLLTLLTDGNFCAVHGLGMIEGGADIELSIGCQRDFLPTCIAVVHLFEHHAVG